MPYIGLPGFPKKNSRWALLWMPRGCPLGHIRTSTGRTPGRDRGLPGQRPPQGGNLKIWKFSEKKLFPVSRPPYYHRPTGCPRTRNVPRGQPPGRYRLGARAPRKCHFCRLQLAYSRNCEHWFSSYLPCGFRVRGSIFCNIRNGCRGLEHPQNRPRRTPRFFAPTFDPLKVPPQKF